MKSKEVQPRRVSVYPNLPTIEENQAFERELNHRRFRRANSRLSMRGARHGVLIHYFRPLRAAILKRWGKR